MSKITINVTQEHIEKGKVGMTNSCPIALACSDAGLPTPFVTWDTIEWGPQGEDGIAVPTPHIAQTFIEDFDAEEYVVPFSFDIEFAPVNNFE